MKVKKITINAELLDIPEDRDRMDFAVIPPMAVRAYAKDGELPTEELTGQRVTYEVRTVGGYGEREKYLVRVDDRKLFNDLMEITEEVLDRAVRKRTEQYESLVKLAREQAIEGIERANQRVVNRIKKLPWHKRLLKDF